LPDTGALEQADQDAGGAKAEAGSQQHQDTEPPLRTAHDYALGHQCLERVGQAV